MVVMNEGIHLSFAQDDFDSWMNRGIEAYRQAHLAEAVQSFEHAVAVDPKSSLAHVSLALSYLAAYIAGADSPENHAAGRNAEEHLREALAIDSRSSVALGYLAQFCDGASRIAKSPDGKTQRLDEAESLYQRILEIEPENKEAFYALGVVAFEKTNQLDDAIQRFSRAIEIDPGYEEAMLFLGLVLRKKSVRYRAASDQWISKARRIRTEREAQWLAAHPKTGNEPPCQPQAMCFEPDPAAAGAKPTAWPPVWWGMMIGPSPPPRPAPPIR